ncbi:MAG: DUF4040 domain-containing protein, partial [Devosiaceae bacterium]|nr:DUF4040 domain-containing protein [Devosiaceae bacterium]
LYLLAHAFYKGALFMVAGGVDHATGTRDITQLGGLWKVMPVTFVAVLIGVAGMAGVPATVAFLAKEEMYAVLEVSSVSDLFENWQNTLVVFVMLLGNAMMMAVGLTILVKAFFGKLKTTPHKAHEGSLSLWIGALVLGVFAIWAGTQIKYLGSIIVGPVASSVANFQISPKLHLDFEMLTTLPFFISTLTWVVGFVIYLAIEDIRAIMLRTSKAIGWTFDILFDWLMFGLIKLSAAVTRFWHHGRLELYLIVVFVGFALAMALPMIGNFNMPQMPGLQALSFFEWGIFGMAVVGLSAVVLAKTRLIAIVSLGIQGFAVALIFMLFGAPDLGFTQFMVETLSVVILALVMTRLHLEQRDARVPWEVARDAALSLTVGISVTVLMISVLQNPIDLRLSEFFALTSVPIAHGHNIVNVILVDYRGLDTLGEISVVLATGIAILALIRIRGGGPQTGVGAPKGVKKPKRARKATPAKSKRKTTRKSTKSAQKKPAGQST